MAALPVAMVTLGQSLDAQFSRLPATLTDAADAIRRLDAFMVDLVTRDPGLSKLLAISQASGFLRGTPVTVRDLGDAYDRATARTAATS